MFCGAFYLIDDLIRYYYPLYRHLASLFIAGQHCFFITTAIQDFVYVQGDEKIKVFITLGTRKLVKGFFFQYLGHF